LKIDKKNSEVAILNLDLDYKKTHIRSLFTVSSMRYKVIIMILIIW